MKVLILGPRTDALVSIVRSSRDQVVEWEQPLTPASPILDGVQYLASYGYRHIIPASVLAMLPNRAINLHISLLPWNRGSDPNLWSFLDDTPRGVTIHVLDAGLDTGPVLAQRPVDYEPEDTLATSYQRLRATTEDLFGEMWPRLRIDSVSSRPQVGKGTFHRLRDKEHYAHLLTDGWNTSVSGLIGAARGSHR